MSFHQRCVMLAAVLILFAGAASGGGAPNEHARICNQIAQRHLATRKPMPQREISFFMFDAAEWGCNDLIEAFMAEGASVIARDRFGNTALLVAAKKGHVAAIEMLVAAGSDVNHRNLAGSSSLLRAVTDRRRRAAKVLLGKGADPN